MEIPDIGVRNIGIPNIGVNPIFQPGIPRNFVIHPPITDFLWKPIVAYPGCIEEATAIEEKANSSEDLFFKVFTQVAEKAYIIEDNIMRSEKYKFKSLCIDS